MSKQQQFQFLEKIPVAARGKLVHFNGKSACYRCEPKSGNSEKLIYTKNNICHIYIMFRERGEICPGNTPITVLTGFEVSGKTKVEL